MESSMIVSGTAAEVCPAGTTTLAGTWAAVGSLDESPTLTGAAGAALIETTPCTVPAPSTELAGALRESVAVSLSSTVMVAAASAIPAADAVI